MEIPTHLKYTSSHEWIGEDEADIVMVGITDFAQSQLGDIVFVEPPEVGQTLKMGEEAGVIESVKAASDIYAPISGEVVAVNEPLAQAPEMLNQDPYEKGWLFKLKISDPSEVTSLLNAEAYQAALAEQE